MGCASTWACGLRPGHFWVCVFLLGSCWNPFLGVPHLESGLPGWLPVLVAHTLAVTFSLCGLSFHVCEIARPF